MSYDAQREALVVLSGGQDSTTCLFWAMTQWDFDAVHAVVFDYGQTHARELDAAEEVWTRAIKEHPTKRGSFEIVEMGKILQGTSPLVTGEKPEQYEDYNSLPGGLEATFVPMRNQLFLTVAANRAYVKGCRDMVTGVCQEDFGGYPDCRRSFIDAFTLTTNLGTFTGDEGAIGSVTIHTPLMYKTKKEAVWMATGMTGCWEALAWSHTAYDGEYPPTGNDHASLLRAKGFAEANWPDPLVLRAVWDNLMEMPDQRNYHYAITLFHARYNSFEAYLSKVKETIDTDISF